MALFIYINKYTISCPGDLIVGGSLASGLALLCFVYDLTLAQILKTEFKEATGDSRTQLLKSIISNQTVVDGYLFRAYNDRGNMKEIQ